MRNEWYVVAFSHEVDTTRPLLRYCCGDRIILRPPMGLLVALYDRCPHRGSPLSLGKIAEDTLQRGYRRFPVDGVRPMRARAEPGDDRSRIAARSYPARRSRRVRLALARSFQETADPVLLPDRFRVRARPARMVGEALSDARDQGKLFAALRESARHLAYLVPAWHRLDGGRMGHSTFGIESEGRIVQPIRAPARYAYAVEREVQYGLRGITTFDRQLESIKPSCRPHIVRNTFTFPRLRPDHALHARINVMPITPSRENEPASS